MGIAYACDTQRRITYSVWDDVISLQDWEQNIATQLADPDWRASKIWLSDQSTVSDYLSIDFSAIEHNAAQYEGIQEVFSKRVALVAGKCFKELKMVERAVGKIGISVIVFNELEIACTYLGLRNAQTRALLDSLRAELRKHDPQPAGLKITLDGRDF